MCARYGCPKRGSKSFVTPKTIPGDKPKDLVARDNDKNCYKLADNEDSCFDDEFDPINSLSEEENGGQKVEFKSGADFDEEQTSTTSWTPTTLTANGRTGDSESDLSAGEMPNRSNTMTVPSYAQCKQGNQVAVVGGGGKSHCARHEMVNFETQASFFLCLQLPAQEGVSCKHDFRVQP